MCIIYKEFTNLSLLYHCVDSSPISGAILSNLHCDLAWLRGPEEFKICTKISLELYWLENLFTGLTFPMLIL